MSIYDLVHGQSAHDKIKELSEMYVHCPYITKAFLLHADDTLCERVLEYLKEEED